MCTSILLGYLVITHDKSNGREQFNGNIREQIEGFVEAFRLQTTSKN